MKCNQPALTKSRPAWKGNPMKANARHVPGSTRSCRTLLSRSATTSRRFRTLGKSTYKTQTKYRQKRKRDFFICSASTTYSFNPITCLNFPGAVPRLTAESQMQNPASSDNQSEKPVDSYSFSLGEKVRMRDKPVHSVRPPSRSNNCTEWDKTGRISYLTKTDHALPTTYDDTASSRPILRVGARCSSLDSRRRPDCSLTT